MKNTKKTTSWKERTYRTVGKWRLVRLIDYADGMHGVEVKTNTKHRVYIHTFWQDDPHYENVLSTMSEYDIPLKVAMEIAYMLGWDSVLIRIARYLQLCLERR